MAKWKPLTLSSDLLSKSGGELLGIEELQNPDESFIVRGNAIEKKKVNPRKRKQATEKKPAVQKKKQKDSGTEIARVCFEGFSHHNEMLSWSHFGLREEILAALYDKRFYEPTEIQLKCLGPSVQGHCDILGAAETGSGKTLAFGIPIVDGILKLKDKLAEDDTISETSDISETDWENNESEFGCVKVKNLKLKNEKNRLFALILTPTRELAVQVKDHLTDICKYTAIKIVLVVGGLAHEKQERLLKKRPEIIVATPGRLWDLIETRNIHLQEINKVRYLAIDETDRMLERGHFQELNKLLDWININEKEKKNRQNFVFSATLTLVHDPPSYLKGEKKVRITPGQKLQELIKRIGITNPKVVDITNPQITPDNLKEYKVICKFEEKDYYLYYFLRHNKGKTIIFCNSIGCIKRLANLLIILNFGPLPLHANMMQKQRLKNLEKFRDNEQSILIATDVAARGLDIKDVDHVLHYQVPKTAETYVHRSGRTARRLNSGNVLLLIEPQEYKSYLKLIHTLGRNNEVQDLGIDDTTLNCLKKVIHLARDIDQLMLAIKKQNSSKSWYMKAMDDMDILVDEDEMPMHLSDEGCKRIKNDLQLKRKQLKMLLEKPVGPRPFSGKFPSSQETRLALFGGDKHLSKTPKSLKKKKHR